MPIFLFLKQIVDMLYQFQILDYGLVLLVVILIAYKGYFIRGEINWKKKVCVTDGFVVGLMILHGISYVKYMPAYAQFFKIESAFLVYFLGRLYGKDILDKGKWLAVASYIVIYLNFIYRFYQFGWKFIVTGPEVTLLNSGGLYYYKTDLAIGVIIAVLFIYMYSENKWLKYLTVFPVAGYLVLYSGARMEKVIFIVEYILILLYELETRKHRMIGWKRTYIRNVMIVGGAIISVIFIALQFIPFNQILAWISLDSEIGMKLEHIMHSRHILWLDILEYFREQPFLTRLFGIDLATEAMHNSLGQRAHSTYIKMIYSIGYLGCALWYGFLTIVVENVAVHKNRKLAYMIVVLWIMLLGAGLTIESLESTQMSWFPMLFSGVLISTRKEDEAYGYHGK